MDPLERFLTLFIKELKENGYIYTFEKYAEITFRLGFEILADLAVTFLKNIIRCFSCYKNHSDSSNSDNPIIKILFKLIKKFGLFEFNTIRLYVKAAIQSLNKLLEKYRSSKPSYGKYRSAEPSYGKYRSAEPSYGKYRSAEPSSGKHNEIMFQPIPINRCSSCASKDVFTQPRADIEASGMPRYPAPNTNPVKIRPERNFGTNRIHMSLDTENRENLGANSIHVTVNTQHSADIGTNSIQLSINTQHITNIEANSMPTTLNTPNRRDTESSSKSISINTMHTTNIEAKNTSMAMRTQHGTKLEANNTTMAMRTQHGTKLEAKNVPMAMRTKKRTEIKAINMSDFTNKNNSESRTNSCIVGSKIMNNTNFKGVERKIYYYYYIGGVSLITSEQDIIDFFKLNIPNGSFECVKLTSKGRMQSFKLTANSLVKKELENPTNWPLGVRVQPWVRKDKMPPSDTQAP